MLTLSWAVPLAGALLLLLVGNADGRRNALVRWLALAVSLATFGVTLALWIGFDSSSAEFQFVERVPWIPRFGIDYYIGIDGISLMLVVLTGFLTPIALLSSWESIDRKVKEFSIFMLALEAAMIGVFVSLDLFLFYVFWDAMLVPMYFLIGIWGYDQRIYAAVKFMLYTMAGSVLMLVAILGLASRYQWVELPEQFKVFDNLWIIGIAALLYVIEFVADKVPWVDSIWDSVHTLIRPVGGALIAVASLGELRPSTPM